MEAKTKIRTFISLEEGEGRNKKIPAQQILILGKSGSGKSLASEFLTYQLWKAGYIVFVIADPKDELEYAYSMFKPEAYYHLDKLKREGQQPQAMKVKLYHPFTFNIPKERYLPEINFFTFSVKDLGRKEWGMLAESEWDSDTISLLINACDEITNEDGLFGLTHAIRDMVKGKKERGKLVADYSNWGLDTPTGTKKSLPELARYIKPFKNDYFLCKDNSPNKLNWKEIMKDQQHYHVFVNKWIKDEKIKSFSILTLLNQIIKYREYTKHPICIVIPEIRKLCPFKPEGFMAFLAKSIKEALTTIRSQGRGMSSILDSQVYEDIDEDVIDSITETFIGQLAGIRDIEKLAKARNWKRETREKVANMGKRNCYLRMGYEGDGGFIIPFPPHCHKEQEYNFFDMYHKHCGDNPELYPERRYADLVKEMEKMFKDEEDKIRKKIEKEIAERKAEEERKQKEAEERQNPKEPDAKIERAKQVIEKSKEKLMKFCFEMKRDNPEMSFREIGRKLEINKNTAKKYAEQYSEVIKQEETKDFEDKVVEELESEETENYNYRL